MSGPGKLGIGVEDGDVGLWPRTGLDDLDIITTEEGGTAVRAGRYLNENVYLDVQSDTRGESEAAVNLEVNRNVTARASVGSDGNTTFGIFFERDY